MSAEIDAFLSAHATIVLWAIIIILWVIVGIFVHKSNKFIRKRMREQLKKDLQEIKKEEQKENEAFRAASKPLTQQSFEEWKAEKRKRDQGGFVDLDAPIRLPWRRTV